MSMTDYYAECQEKFDLFWLGALESEWFLPKYVGRFTVV